MGPESCELGPDLCLNMGPAIRDWVPLIPSDSYLEMGGVCLAPRALPDLCLGIVSGRLGS